MPDLSATILEPLPDGSFRLRRGDGIVLSATRTPDGFRIEGEGIDDWSIIEAGLDERGYVLISGSVSEAGEIGRTCRSADGGEVGTVWALLDDGRLFVIRVAGLEPVVVELGSDEVPGAYWIASAHRDGWGIACTAAGRHVEGGLALWALFGSELMRWSRQEGS